MSTTSLFRSGKSSASMYVQMFKSSMLYKVSILYTTSRLFLTISLIYMPVVFVVGSLLGLFGCIIILWTPFNSDQQVLNVYAAAVCFGLGSSVTMVISLCSTANLVGTDTQYGAFIYSTVTFSDKLLNGLAVIIIEYLRCESKELCPTYYRQVLSYVNGALSIIGICILFTLPKKLLTSH
ncbi:hypothetical protein M8J75_008444 [Diaphorina citri]|nr:hypothetical protein M8J75_008444 [Diaphorina citri]